jgi:BirA family biotin operon repressor/biotin-[acetyl-CoA-carboxylase] ligase
MPASDPPACDPIDAAAVVATTGLASFEHLVDVGSTMERARELALDPGCPLPAAVVADRQSAGRGRRGAAWWQADASLAVSVVVDAGPGCAAPPAVWSLACGVALAEALAAVEPAVEPVVRWPNDVEVGGRKLAGILVEAPSGGRAVVGVGVNTAGSSREAPPALQQRLVTLPDLTGRVLPRQRLLVAFLPRLFALLAETVTSPTAFVERYRARCGLDGHPVTVFRGGERLTGICRGIAADGSLVLDTPAGRRLVTSGSLTDPDQVWRGG